MEITDHNLMDIVKHGNHDFPIQYYVDELYKYPNQMIPLHWHSDLEFYQAFGGDVKIIIEDIPISLHTGDVIFINSNVFHSFIQKNKEDRCCCPNIVFSREMIASFNSTVYKKYIYPILSHFKMPYIIFSKNKEWHLEIINILDSIFSLLQKYGDIPDYYGRYPTLDFQYKDIDSSCFELEIQMYLTLIWKILYSHIDDIPDISLKANIKQVTQIRTHQMLKYIQSNYSQAITLNDIARSAEVSKSEASRCFHSFLHMSPIQYLLLYRLKQAEDMLIHSYDSISSIALQCGFESVSYFGKRFLKKYKVSASNYRKLYQR